MFFVHCERFTLYTFAVCLKLLFCQWEGNCSQARRGKEKYKTKHEMREGLPQRGEEENFVWKLSFEINFICFFILFKCGKPWAAAESKRATAKHWKWQGGLGKVISSIYSIYILTNFLNIEYQYRPFIQYTYKYSQDEISISSIYQIYLQIFSMWKYTLHRNICCINALKI